MERKLVVGIRDFCILSSWKACLEENEWEKLTREVLSVLMGAQKSTRRRVEWIKWGLFTVGFFVWSIPHCTVCPARWLVSSSSVCNPSSDPFVKSHRSPSSFTLSNIFWGISLPKTSVMFSILSYYILSPPENLKSMSWVEVVKRTQQNSHMENLKSLDCLHEIWHTCSACSWLQTRAPEFLIVDQGLSYGLWKLKKRG